MKPMTGWLQNQSVEVMMRKWGRWVEWGGATAKAVPSFCGKFLVRTLNSVKALWSKILKPHNSSYQERDLVIKVCILHDTHGWDKHRKYCEASCKGTCRLAKHLNCYLDLLTFTLVVVSTPGHGVLLVCLSARTCILTCIQCIRAVD